jgi:hypothetical protein
MVLPIGHFPPVPRALSQMTQMLPVEAAAPRRAVAKIHGLLTKGRNRKRHDPNTRVTCAISETPSTLPEIKP